MLLYGTLHVLYIQYTSSCYWSIILRYRITLGSAEVGREKWEERSGNREVGRENREEIHVSLSLSFSRIDYLDIIQNVFSSTYECVERYLLGRISKIFKSRNEHTVR